MIRTKLGLLGLCAVVLGMMAMSASSAQAALSWLILPTGGGTATNLKAKLVGENDSTHYTLQAEIVGLNVNFTCTNLEFINAFIEPEEKLSEGGKVKFSGCEAYEGAGPLGAVKLNCNVPTIETNELKGLLELVAGEVVAKIEPKTGEVFATIKTTGCSLPESNPVKGVLTLKDCLHQATEHKERHLVEAGPGTALFVGAHSVMKLELTKLVGSAWVKLGGEHETLLWSAMDA